MEKELIDKSHWLIKVSRAHFITRELLPKRHFLVCRNFDPLTFF